MNPGSQSARAIDLPFFLKKKCPENGLIGFLEGINVWKSKSSGEFVLRDGYVQLLGKEKKLAQVIGINQKESGVML